MIKDIHSKINEKDFIYHNVYGVDRLKSILESGKIRSDPSLKFPCVCFTRDKSYLSSRGIQLVFNRRALKTRLKVKPFCYFGWMESNNVKTKLKFVDEFEERVYGDVPINRYLVCIKIDSKLLHKIPAELKDNPLIVYENFR